MVESNGNSKKSEKVTPKPVKKVTFDLKSLTIDGKESQSIGEPNRIEDLDLQIRNIVLDDAETSTRAAAGGEANGADDKDNQNAVSSAWAEKKKLMLEEAQRHQQFLTMRNADNFGEYTRVLEFQEKMKASGLSDMSSTSFV